MSELRIMMGAGDRTAETLRRYGVEPTPGDTRVVWDPAVESETASARRIFDDLRGSGYAAYSIAEGGGRGEVVREFDPTATKVILAPPMAGG